MVKNQIVASMHCYEFHACFFFLKSNSWTAFFYVDSSVLIFCVVPVSSIFIWITVEVPLVWHKTVSFCLQILICVIYTFFVVAFFDDSVINLSYCFKYLSPTTSFTSFCYITSVNSLGFQNIVWIELQI